jgi:hypothetical protein
MEDNPRKSCANGVGESSRRTIVATLIGRLQTAIVEGAKRKPPCNLAAYECVLRADALPFGDALRLAPDFSVIHSAAKDPFQRETDRQHLIEGMRKAGLPD